MNSINELRFIDGFVYLGSAYSKWEDKELAARIVEKAAANLMNRGLVVYSPIAHGHAIAKHGLPYSWAFWQQQCQPMIDAAAAMIVLRMDGWEESVGLAYEIEEFCRMGKPVVYLDLDNDN